MKKILKNIPNCITVSRILTSILGSVFFISGNFNVALILYIYSAVSDALDGLAARKLNAYSELGRILDAISDKLFSASLLIPSIILGNYLMIMPLFEEFKISTLNIKANKNNINLSTTRIGKFKTIFLFPTIILGLLASKNNIFYLLLAPFLLMTCNLQIKAIKSYEKQINEKVNNEFCEDYVKMYNKEFSLKENLINLRNELMQYAYEDETINVKVRSKKK